MTEFLAPFTPTRKRASGLAHNLRPVFKVFAFTLIVAGIIWLIPTDTWAQSVTLNLGPKGSASTTGRVIQLLLLLTVLSIAPGILIMMTSFTRIVVVLSFLRSALGTQQTPPNQVLVSLALFLTLFIMMPTLQASYNGAVQPLLDGSITESQAFDRGLEPFKKFMSAHVSRHDLALFVDMAGLKDAEIKDGPPLRVLIPAFMISELKRAFEIGFLLFVPFLIIDMVVASILMAMGMMMLPPVVIALPFKIIFFVLVDGWYMVVGSLVRSYGL